MENTPDPINLYDEDLYTNEDIEINEILINPTKCKEVVNELRKELKTLFDKKMSKLGLEVLNIALVGRMGNAKSTITNGFYQALHGVYSRIATADNSNGQVTKRINNHTMEGSDKTPETKTCFKYINIIDIFGNDGEDGGIWVKSPELIEKFMKGSIKSTLELDEKSNLPQNLKEHYNENQNLKKMPHVVLYLSEWGNFDDKIIIESTNLFFNKIKQQGIPGFGILPKIDLIPDHKHFYDKKVMKYLKNFREKFGFNSVYPLKNYTEADKIQDINKDFMYLYILKRALLLAQEYILTSKEIVALNDQFEAAEDEKWIQINTLQMNVKEFENELRNLFPDEEYHVEIGSGQIIHNNAKLESIKLRDVLTPLDDEPSISQIIVHKQILLKVQLGNSNKVWEWKTYPMMSVSEAKEKIRENCYKNKKDIKLQFDGEDPSKTNLRDYITISGHEYYLKVSV